MTIPTDGRIDLGALAELATELREWPGDGDDVRQRAADAMDSLIDLARRAAIPSEQGEAVGEAGTMPGTDGFTMAVFRAADVPVGTKLYAHPAPAAGVKVKAEALLAALQRYGFPVSTAAVRALVDGGSIEAQAVHVAAIQLRAALALDQGEPK